MDWTYVAIMTAAIVTGFALYRLTAEPLPIAWWESVCIGLGAFCGGMIGAKLPFLLADWSGLVDGTAWLADGKTIVSGLVGGYLGVQVAEWALGLEVKICDSFAVPVAAAIAVGRLGCFHAGCCHGTITSVPWAVDFGDGHFRHPTQLYESAFHLIAALALYQLLRHKLFQGQLIRIYFIAYFLYRFATEFIRPEPRIWMGLTGYQLAALAMALILIIWGFPCCNSGSLWRKRRLVPARHFTPDPTPRQLKETTTLCPTCLQYVPGVVFSHHGKVFMRHSCPEHGETMSLVSSDRRHYYLRDEVPHSPLGKESSCCGTPGHKTCVALLELTDACNLKCPVCFARSPSGKHRPYDQLCADLDAFVNARGSLDILQLSGGEPLLHPELLRIIDHARTLPIDHVMINTNGLELVRRKTLAAELAERKPRLELSVQFDGLDRASHQTLRGADLLDEKRALIEIVQQYDLPTTLVCTLVSQVNEDQLGHLVRLGLSTPQLRGITFQPATWSGRYDADIDPLDRVTLADVVRLLVDQCDGLLKEDDFQPLPCGDPNCCGFTFILRRRLGRAQPFTRLVRLEDHIDRVSDRMNFNLDDARHCCGVSWRPQDFFRVVIKPFMDVHTYDQDRIAECCIHIIQPGGSAVSFCQFNTLMRGREQERLISCSK